MHRIRMMMFFLASCVGVQMRPSAIEKVELVTALARGPLQIVSLRAQISHQPAAGYYKIAAELTRIFNDCASMATHHNYSHEDYYYSQQIARIIHTSLHILDFLRSQGDDDVDVSWIREKLIDLLYLIESATAVGVHSSSGPRLANMKDTAILQMMLSIVQSLGSSLLDKNLSMIVANILLLCSAVGMIQVADSIDKKIPKMREQIWRDYQEDRKFYRQMEEDVLNIVRDNLNDLRDDIHPHGGTDMHC